jgi:hypothetical protein
MNTIDVNLFAPLKLRAALFNVNRLNAFSKRTGIPLIGNGSSEKPGTNNLVLIDTLNEPNFTVNDPIDRTRTQTPTDYLCHQVRNRIFFFK